MDTNTWFSSVGNTLRRWLGLSISTESHAVEAKQLTLPTIEADTDSTELDSKSAVGSLAPPAGLHDNKTVPYDPELFDRVRLQWRMGEWEKLTKLDIHAIDNHPERAKLALVVGSAWQQKNNPVTARNFVKLAKSWGCDEKLISKILIAGVHNTLGRASIISEDQQRSKNHFRYALEAAGGNIQQLIKTRIAAETARLELPDLHHVAKNIQAGVQHYGNTDSPLATGQNNEANPFYDPITAYAQNFEDVMLWRALHHVTDGCYIDIGANHPIDDSVSRAFYEKGWRGLHVEPLQFYTKLLRENRPDEIVLQAALTDDVESGPVVFYEITSALGLSTGNLTIAMQHREKGYDFIETTVPSMTLADIFERVGTREVHWLKIDVEGMEDKVLRGWGNSTQLPWIVVVEATLPNTQIEVHDRWEHFLTSRGYQAVYFDGANRFYLSAHHHELARAFRTGPNAFDGFALSGRGGPYCWKLNNEIVSKTNEIERLHHHISESNQQNTIARSN